MTKQDQRHHAVYSKLRKPWVVPQLDVLSADAAKNTANAVVPDAIISMGS